MESSILLMIPCMSVIHGNLFFWEKKRVPCKENKGNRQSKLNMLSSNFNWPQLRKFRVWKSSEIQRGHRALKCFLAVRSFEHLTIYLGAKKWLTCLRNDGFSRANYSSGFLCHCTFYLAFVMSFEHCLIVCVCQSLPMLFLSRLWFCHGRYHEL